MEINLLLVHLHVGSLVSLHLPTSCIFFSFIDRLDSVMVDEGKRILILFDFETAIIECERSFDKINLDNMRWPS